MANKHTPFAYAPPATAWKALRGNNAPARGDESGRNRNRGTQSLPRELRPEWRTALVFIGLYGLVFGLAIGYLIATG